MDVVGYRHEQKDIVSVTFNFKTLLIHINRGNSRYIQLYKKQVLQSKHCEVFTLFLIKDSYYYYTLRMHLFKYPNCKSVSRNTVSYANNIASFNAVYCFCHDRFLYKERKY
ncbi:hypothetical protein QKQ25_gp021 [Hyphantria cunea granulovirus]|uniref:Uncharacterized protein n=1 Tax=Hyphantria cunea granulovirus TaxID=307448 RepID=A0AAF1D258_9BBAC|nr:hypothetical protein QKQ25_gp021 [Hyphantria cunea granulovirus]QBQ01574.1 hypothetical protein HycuGV_00021 [Hyphantria cunea granulovirus]